MKKKKICFVTGTRAEYGLLKSLIKKIKLSRQFELQIIVTGSHLTKDHGCTINEIYDDGLDINAEVQMLLSSDSDVGIAKSLGLGIIGFADVLQRLSPDLIIILGDRYEMLGVASTAMLFRIPIAHIHGGEKTEGLIDEAIRHSITKMSHIHFVATEEYAKRVTQLGENTHNIHVVGGLGVDSINSIDFLSKSEIEKRLDFNFFSRNLLVTFHPETLEKSAANKQVEELLGALSGYKDVGLIFTASNADNEGKEIYKKITNFVNANKNAKLYKSLGQLIYLSCLRYVDGVVGNSSSGLLEAPSFKIGTINIGNRQKGRMQSNSIINCDPNLDSITSGIEKLYSDAFKNTLKNVTNPYGEGGASEKILNILIKQNFHNLIKKEFRDIQIK